jgi:hypothetical protein
VTLSSLGEEQLKAEEHLDCSAADMRRPVRGLRFSLNRPRFLLFVVRGNARLTARMAHWHCSGGNHAAAAVMMFKVRLRL